MIAVRRPLPPPPAWLRPVRLPEGIPIERPAAPGTARPAAALVLVYPGPDGDAWLVLTQRVEYGGDHSGEVSLPGGKVDPDDADEAAGYGLWESVNWWYRHLAEFTLEWELPMLSEEARRIVARFEFSPAQRRHLDQLIDAWERDLRLPGRNPGERQREAAE